MFSVSHEGKSMIDVCNQVGFDYVTLGNHEFGKALITVYISMSLRSFLCLFVKVLLTS